LLGRRVMVIFFLAVVPGLRKTLELTTLNKLFTEVLVEFNLHQTFCRQTL
jgi:hypothetical protein